MNAKYWQKGETLDYTPTAAVANGAVVNLTTRIGIAGYDIAAGETGQVHVSGVFMMDKAAVEIALGAALYYDAENDVITTTAAGNIPAGWAFEAAASAADTVKVTLVGVDPTTPTAGAVAVVAATSGTAITQENGAHAAGEAPTAAEFNAAVDLANANKAEINVLVALANANKTAINAIIATLKSAGLMG